VTSQQNRLIYSPARAIIWSHEAKDIAHKFLRRFIDLPRNSWFEYLTFYTYLL
jgi:hypothetical protein